MAGNVKREMGNLFLEVKGLRVAVAGNEILKGVDLTMRPSARTCTTSGVM